MTCSTLTFSYYFITASSLFASCLLLSIAYMIYCLKKGKKIHIKSETLFSMFWFTFIFPVPLAFGSVALVFGGIMLILLCSYDYLTGKIKEHNANINKHSIVEEKKKHSIVEEKKKANINFLKNKILDNSATAEEADKYLHLLYNNSGGKRG